MQKEDLVVMERNRRIDSLSTLQLSELKKYDECVTDRDREVYMMVAGCLAKIQDADSGLFDRLKSLNPEFVSPEKDNATCCYMRLDKKDMNLVITNIIKAETKHILTAKDSFRNGSIPASRKNAYIDTILRKAFIDTLGAALSHPQFNNRNLAKKNVQIGKVSYVSAIYSDLSQRESVDKAIDVIRQYGKDGTREMMYNGQLVHVSNIYPGLEALKNMIASGEFGGNKESYQNRNARTIPVCNVNDNFFQDLYITEIEQDGTVKDQQFIPNADVRIWTGYTCNRIGAQANTVPKESSGIQKHENQTSTPHQDIQRAYMPNTVTVTDLDCFRMKDGQITEVLELKRVQEKLDDYNPNIEHYRDTHSEKGRNFKNQIMIQSMLADAIGAEYYMLCNEGIHPGHEYEDMDHIKIYFGAYSQGLIGQFAFTTYHTYSAEEIASFKSMKALIDYDLRISGRATPRLVRHHMNESPVPKTFQGKLEKEYIYKHGEKRSNKEWVFVNGEPTCIHKFKPCRPRTNINLYKELDCKYKLTDFLMSIRPESNDENDIRKAYQDAGYPEFAIRNILKIRSENESMEQFLTSFENRPLSLDKSVLMGKAYYQYDNREMGISIPLERDTDFSEMDQKEYLYVRESNRTLGYDPKSVHRKTMSPEVQKEIRKYQRYFLETLSTLPPEKRTKEWESYEQAMNLEKDKEIIDEASTILKITRDNTATDILPYNFMAQSSPDYMESLEEINTDINNELIRLSRNEQALQQLQQQKLQKQIERQTMNNQNSQTGQNRSKDGWNR